MKVASTDIQVRYAETDQMGVVHHSQYLVWCEIGRTDLINALGFSYAKLEESGVLAPVTEANLSYVRAIRYGDTVRVETWIDDYNGIRATYGYAIYNEDDQLCVSGTTTHVLVDSETFRPRSMKKLLPEWHDVYEREKRG
ncbi:acyl-CoA thioesterase [Natribacillus halophilus]|uniref:Acyl-CoA thioester hydrolase n=1 Tax=Natribacillus halophilus TaxID=549003 RepID=A0A1G8SIE2_9BACI|nr:thioesterase family protein [Natribacillus halophilus]SDJ29018.1 acyl-CoA thioester hydrolase [Natribacillus halophilus]